MSEYGFRIRLAEPTDAAIARVTQALKEQGFGVLTEIDVQATLKKKLDVDFRPYVILGACNPNLAHRALSEELEIGLMLPCNVIVFDDGQGGSVVSIVDPFTMLGVVDNEQLRDVAREADRRLRLVAASLN